jgi:biopolymer transport protein ExbD
MARRGAPPEVNAGSMADIAFLLLIFFLVTTTIETDKGLNRKLPPIDETEEKPLEMKEKNIFLVMVNRNNQLLVNNELMELEDLKQAAIDFIDNNGDGSCNVCAGLKDPKKSDNPDKAVVSLMNDAETNYKTYVSVQNEILAAYYELRDRYAKATYNRTFRELEAKFEDPQTKDEALKEKLKVMIEDIQKVYPQKLSEADAQRG